MHVLTVSLKMIRILTTLLLFTVSLMADAGLFVHDRNKNSTETLEDGYLIVRYPMERVKITHVVLRYDTEDKKIIWLELHMEDARDSSDFYYCTSVPERTHDRQFYTRSSEFNDRGCKWALRFDTLEDARTSFIKIKTAYDLDDKHSLDKTEG